MSAVFDYDHCNLTHANNCLYDGLSFEESVYCCNYVLNNEMGGYFNNYVTQNQLYTQVTAVKDLNVAALIIDYIFVAMAICTFGILYCMETEDEFIRKRVLIITTIGTVIDIALTFSIVGVISTNNLIDVFLNLYDAKCYSEDMERTIFDFQSQFETILTLDVVEGAFDLIGLIILFLTYFVCRDKFMDKAEGIHGFIFVIFDITLVSMNVFLFTLPMYNSFISTYDGEEYVCFESTIYGSDPEWLKDDETTTTTQLPQSTHLTEVTEGIENKSWFHSQGRHIQIWFVIGCIVGSICICTCFCIICCSLSIGAERNTGKKRKTKTDISLQPYPPAGIARHKYKKIRINQNH